MPALSGLFIHLLSILLIPDLAAYINIKSAEQRSVMIEIHTDVAVIYHCHRLVYTYFGVTSEIPLLYLLQEPGHFLLGFTSAFFKFTFWFFLWSFEFVHCFGFRRSVYLLVDAVVLGGWMLFLRIVVR